MRVRVLEKGASRGSVVSVGRQKLIISFISRSLLIKEALEIRLIVCSTSSQPFWYG